MKSEIKKIIEKEIEKYAIKEIRISNKKYPLYIVPALCDEDLNIFEGFLLVEAKDKGEVSYLKTRYKPPVSGYAPRLSIVLYDDYLLIKDYRINKYIIKTLKKVNRTFINKFKKALSEPGEENFRRLFDRTDIIEEFYILYKKAREYLLKNISGISEEEKREEFIDNFMMQMLTLWYLQERGFFNNDRNYFITKFKELSQRKLFGGFKNYYEFLTYFFEKISGNLDSQYYEDKNTGKVVVIGPAVFLNGEHSKAITISDKCFYKEGMTDILINTPPKKVSQEIPLLNLFESRDWTEGNIDEFVLGAIYEKLITYMERKKLGAYYTPEEITSYICKNTIEPYLVDRINEKFGKKFETIDQIIESDDRKIILYLFEQLKEIKVLDPAVGSAHFLESAIDVLVKIYKKIWEKARELNIKKGLEIVATDEKGEIIEINLLEISDEDKFELLVKFFIIISKNIYGVDINPSALKVAKARLFLTLAKHFKIGKENDIFIRFPNVHFNLREGNSLIGYVEIGEEKKEIQLQLSLFTNEKQTDYVTKKIKVVSALKPYLEKVTRRLKINGDVVKEIDELNKILSRKKINWNDFEKVLQIKEKLVKILIASLNSQYAVPLNDLLREITDLFNQKLDEKFAEEHNIELGDLKKIKTFHWIFEFPEVFLDRGGFDVVVGNPPYGNIFTSTEKEIIQKIFTTVEGVKGSYNSASIFLERSDSLSKGYVSLIVPNTISRISEFFKIRKFMMEKFQIISIAKMGNPFVGVHLEMDIYILKKLPLPLKYQVEILDNNFNTINKVNIDVFQKYVRFIYMWDEIAKHIWSTSFIDHIKSKRGPDKEYQIECNQEFVIPFLYNHNSIDKYRVVHYVYTNDKSPKMRFFKVLSSRNMYRVYRCIWNPKVFYPGTGIAIILKNDNSNLDKHYIPILNSHLMDYITQRYIFNLHNKPSNLQEDVTKFTPIRISSNTPLFEIIADYLLFLNATEERRQKLKDKIEFFDRQIADSLVYELYFKEKFAEDSIYPEPKDYLLEAISKHLKPINYDRWAELYWKKQLERNLTPGEKRELEKLEKENLNITEKVYIALQRNKEIREWIDKIKSHKWVKVIEEEKRP